MGVGAWWSGRASEEGTCELSAEDRQDARWSRGRVFLAEGTVSAKASGLEQVWFLQGRPTRLKLAKIDEQGRSFQIPFTHEAFTATNDNIGVKKKKIPNLSKARAGDLHLIQFSQQFNSYPARPALEPGDMGLNFISATS